MLLLAYSSLHFFVCKVSSNFAEYFDQLSKRVAQLSNCCPQFSGYAKLFPTSVRLQQALFDGIVNLPWLRLSDIGDILYARA
ncbi:uncharacterized protein K441DRAFT_661894 [Cenococcum geophilum 1.58]|uniref:uncharacterized protein n=1 Tax=Cenococcum geophilum 1.58 TaxID=794803 RepID=UPI00358E2E18|nr:hypothetical protein K441DRAFT_661894 [Cenococcum geophilum 1.58]